jgi:hypothetical protein
MLYQLSYTPRPAAGLRHGGGEIKGRMPGWQWEKSQLNPSHIQFLEHEQMIPARFAPILFGFVLSGLMSLIVSGISTGRALGFSSALPATWAGNWALSWLVAFPTVLVVAPIARKLVARLTTK